MDIFELLANVKSGRITSTHEYRVSAIKTNEDSVRYKTFESIVEAVGSGYLQGERDDKAEAINYKNLKLTTKGERFHEFGALTADQIKNPTISQKIYNGIIGSVSGKLFLALCGVALTFFSPDINNKIKSLVASAKKLMESVIE